MPEKTPLAEHAAVRYKKSDARIGVIIAFGIMLAVMGLIVQMSAAWLFDCLKERTRLKDERSPSLAVKERVQLPRDLDKIPQPRLQQAEIIDMAKLRQAENALLNSYGWVDRKAGIVRIPIDEAMRFLADPKTAAAKGIRARSLKENKE